MARDQALLLSVVLCQKECLVCLSADHLNDSPFYALLFHAIEMIDECCCTMHCPIMMADCLAAKKVVIYGCLTLLFTPDCD